MATTPQIRLLDLPGVREITPEISTPFREDQVGFPDQDRSDASMLKEAVGNRMLSEGFIAGRGLAAMWDLTGVILRAFVEPVKWRGSDQFRSSLGIPLLAENFYSSLSVFQQQLFSGYEPFKIEETVATTLDVANAMQAIVEAQLKTAAPFGSTFKQEVRSGMYECLLLGTGVWLRAWEQRTIRKRKLRLKAGYTPQSVPLNNDGATATVHPPDEAYEEYVDEYKCNWPVLEHVPLRRVRFSPDLRTGNIQRAKWRGRLFYPSAYDLDAFRGCEGFNIPTRAELIKLTTPQKQSANQNVTDTMTGSTTAVLYRTFPTAPQQAYPEWQSQASTLDPLAQPFEVFEYYTNNRKCWILEGQVCIMNLPHDGKDMLSMTFRDAPESGLGYGMGMWLADFQRICQGVVNYFFDDLNLNLAGVYQTEQGMDNMGQNAWISPGKVFKKTGPTGLTPMERKPIGLQPLEVIAQVKSWASGISGAGAGIQGSNPGATGDMRTGEGVKMLGQGEGMKMQDLIDQFCDLVLLPFLEFCVENVKKLSPSQMRQMLNDVLAKALENAGPVDVINASYKITISAGARLQARNALNSSLGYIQSILQQPGLSDQLAVQGVKINYATLLEVLFSSTGFPYQYEIIEPMTNEDKQRLEQQQSNGPAKAQLELAKIGAQTQGKIQAQENQGEIRALLEVHKHMLEHFIGKSPLAGAPAAAQ
jgi:hypothetical protein